MARNKGEAVVTDQPLVKPTAGTEEDAVVLHLDVCGTFRKRNANLLRQARRFTAGVPYLNEVNITTPINFARRMQGHKEEGGFENCLLNRRVGSILSNNVNKTVLVPQQVF